MAFLGSFLQYGIIFIILLAIGVLGGLIGVSLRKRKDAKDTAAAAEQMSEDAAEDKKDEQ